MSEFGKADALGWSLYCNPRMGDGPADSVTAPSGRACVGWYSNVSYEFTKIPTRAPCGTVATSREKCRALCLAIRGAASPSVGNQTNQAVGMSSASGVGAADGVVVFLDPFDGVEQLSEVGPVEWCVGDLDQV